VALLKTLGESDGGLDVAGLRRLVSTSKQYDQGASSLGIINPVPRAKVDLQLADTVGKDAMLAWIAVDKSINTDLNTRAAREVLQ
jgi:hypothetical protein